MTGKEKIQAAFAPAGTPEIPVMICYEDIYIRDHWAQLTPEPWWTKHTPDLQARHQLLREIAGKIGQDIFRAPTFYSRAEREALTTEVRSGQVYLVNRKTGEEKLLAAPQVGGWAPGGESQSVHAEQLPATRAEIDRLIPEALPFDCRQFLAEGHGDLAAQLHNTMGRAKAALYHVSSPFWQCYYLWGFEGLMILAADRPELVEYACRRWLSHTLTILHLAKALGTELIWIEECLADMLSPEAFAKLSAPWASALTHEIHSLGMHSIYYFCGNPAGKWEAILATGADALALEESKKGFAIDIVDVARRVNGRAVLLGNLDAIGVLQNGTEQELRSEISRQVAAGRRNGSRFIMSIGSPVTPETPVERVRLYCDLVHDLGSNTGRRA
ncbi:MAG: hypothetical protein HYV35_04835 [Lentisphaerae bacterium]|nr:hypothetical protein [Lentisphaerota bacterium]